MKAIHLKRSAVLAGLVGAAMGAVLLVPAAAQAQVSNPPKGQNPGGMTLSPAAGAGTVTPNFSAAHACPAGTINATISLIDNAGHEQQVGGPFNSTTVGAAPWNGAFFATMGDIFGVSGATGADTFEIVVDCHATAGVPGTFTDSTFVSFNADGSTYSSSATPPAGAVATTTSLTGPSLVQTGGNVTLNATVAPGNAVGKVEFFDGSTSMGAPVTLTNGTAQFSTTTLSTGSHPITAKFEPTDPNAFKTSTSNTVTVTVTSGDVQGETINVNVPRAEGVFTMTVSTTPVHLTDAVLSADNTTFESTGQLGSVTVSDGRNQSQPGWSISGQVSDFSDGTHTFTGNDLGWTPQITTPNAAHDVVAGPAVPAQANPGLKQGSGLASAAVTKGLGTTVLGAALDLKVPSSTAPGAYSATLTITAVEHG
jgi:hypothetical protein